MVYMIKYVLYQSFFYAWSLIIKTCRYISKIYTSTWALTPSSDGFHGFTGEDVGIQQNWL